VYAAYLAISIALTVIVASALSRSGRVYLAHAFGGDEVMAGGGQPVVGCGVFPLSPVCAGRAHRPAGAPARGGAAAGGGGGPGGRGAVGEGRRGAAGARRPAPGEHGVLHPVPPPARSARAGCRGR